MITDGVDLPNARTNNVPLSVPLADVASLASSVVGTKALRLGQILALNCKVPSGFCVTTSAFETFLSYNAIRHTVRIQLQQTENVGILQLEELSRKIAALIQGSGFPREIVESIENSCAELWTLELR